MRRALGRVLVVLAVVGGLSACGDDDGGDVREVGTETGTGSGSGTETDSPNGAGTGSPTGPGSGSPTGP